MPASLFTIVYAFSYRSWYILFHVKSVYTEVSWHSGSHTSAVTYENLGDLVYPGITAAFSSCSVVAHLLVLEIYLDLDSYLAMELFCQIERKKERKELKTMQIALLNDTTINE